jgi:TPR repeat protein
MIDIRRRALKVFLPTILMFSMLQAGAAPTVHENPEAEALLRQGQELLKLTEPSDSRLSELAWSAARYEDDKPYSVQVKQGWRLIEQAADKGSLKAIRCMGIYWSAKKDHGRARPYLEAAGQAGDGAALYYLAQTHEGYGGDHLGEATREETVQMLSEGADDGDTEARWAWCGAYNDGNFPPGQEQAIVAKCKAFGRSTGRNVIHNYWDRCLAHDPQIHCSETTRRVYQRMKDNGKEWTRLITLAAEAGDPTAQREWCRHEKDKSDKPIPAVTEKCRLWNEESGARGGRWAGEDYAYADDPKVARLQNEAHGVGISLRGLSLESIDTERGKRPIDRCVRHYTQMGSHFASVFDEQMCVPPRPDFPKWRGLGKNFKAPPASAAAEKLYRSGLAKLAAQDVKGAAALLKKAAEAGHTGAMINLALAYIEYPEILFDPNWWSSSDAHKPAWELVTQADAKGDIRAHYLLAYFADQGVRPTPVEWKKGITDDIVIGNRVDAERYEREAAERGLARAQYGLAWRLIADERENEGWEWLKKAYENGERIAGFDLYRIARYVWKDNVQALQYLRSTAIDGELASADLLAEIYDKGLLGEAKNPTRAACYRAAVTAHKDMSWEQRLDLRLPDMERCR